MTSSRKARTLITGAEGFVGAHLAAHLRETGSELILCTRPGRDISRLEARESEIFPVELPDRDRLAQIIGETRPDAIVHLAALSQVTEAERQAVEAIRSNVEATCGLLEVLNHVDFEGRARVILASTAHVYRAPSDGETIDERSPVGPQSTYARTKLAAELLAESLTAKRRDLIVFRCFNHTGPGQSPDFVVPGFARQVAGIERSLAEAKVRTGDLDAERDFTDVRDVVRAYALAAAGEVPPGVYNVSSGKTARIGAILDILHELTETPFEVHSTPDPQRPGGIARLVGSSAKLHDVCGWTPEIPLGKTVADTLQWWRQQVSQEDNAKA